MHTQRLINTVYQGGEGGGVVIELGEAYLRGGLIEDFL